MAEYHLADYTLYSDAAATTSNRNEVTATITRSGRLVGFKIPVSQIPNYQKAEYALIATVISSCTVTVGYISDSGFVEGFPRTFTAAMVTSENCIVPCFKITTIKAATKTFTMPPLYVNYSGKNIYLGSDQVQAVYLGDQEVSSVFLGTEEV